MRRLFPLVLLWLAGPALAQSADPMELQRCIWRCLADSPGAQSPQYHACVSRMCTAPPQQQSPAPAPGGAWTGGVASDGVTRFAGIAEPAGSGRGFYFMCDGRGDGYLMLYALDRREGRYQLRIDGRSFPTVFHRARQQLTVDLRPGAPLLDILAGGTWIEIVDPDGMLALSLSLAEAGPALANVRQGCRF
ncbi:hypothetical protein SAMN05444007_103223 [Cribrihabitans marinus]|uniref:Uncharacterized protein n=1 Tax=Cribrihabitans marinus TaxID=1227549 RepID=A0A1H6VLN3_9RHOB|nr:hypothetical protein [Cribrihabitans marinus]GGH25524.1 hypothetical protein GCM10010973_12740 [Cribrihabitans marinus]SEJ05531.1 hypothetical protein SAMN05444007_103223 [Cribrihabitans marinus]